MDSILSSPLLAFIIFLLGILGLFMGFFLIVWRDKTVKNRIDNFIENQVQSISDNGNAVRSTISKFRQRINVFFGGIKSEEMHTSLIAANWPISVNEYIIIRLFVLLLFFAIGWIVGRHILSGIVLAIFGYMAPGFFLFQSILKRQKQFQDQLIDSLSLIRGAIASGNSFQQSLNVVIQEVGAPISDEFKQVRRETELGISLSRALINMADRMENEDFKLVVTAVNINMQVGGNLSSILGVVIETIRQRIALYGEIRALTSYANFASYLLTFLPIATIAILSLLSPFYWERFLSPGITRYILFYALGSVIVGNIILRRIAHVNV
jgi:tight adherence protein B